jgi:hypothetical protein
VFWFADGDQLFATKPAARVQEEKSKAAALVGGAIALAVLAYERAGHARRIKQPRNILKLIAEMECLGHDRAAAESLLALFEEIQRMHQQHRQAIIRELDELDPPLPPQRTGGANG